MLALKPSNLPTYQITHLLILFLSLRPSRPLRLNLSVSRLHFVVGKGGVGKTTVSCAYALHLAARRPRESVLLMSTDPAHSLADMLQLPLKSAPRRIKEAKGNLSAWQIDSDKEFKKFLSANRNAILNIVEN